jgi:hypothetical protein
VPIIEFLRADLRDPFHSDRVYVSHEWVLDCEPDGSCPLCVEPVSNAWDLEVSGLAPEVLAECWEIPVSEAVELAAAIRETLPDLERISMRPHLHLVVRGETPEASPRYYRLPFR